MSANLDRPAAKGVAVRLDDLSRQRLAGGGLVGLVRGQQVVGITKFAASWHQPFGELTPNCTPSATPPDDALAERATSVCTLSRARRHTREQLTSHAASPSRR